MMFTMEKRWIASPASRSLTWLSMLNSGLSRTSRKACTSASAGITAPVAPVAPVAPPPLPPLPSLDGPAGPRLLLKVDGVMICPPCRVDGIRTPCRSSSPRARRRRGLRLPAERALPAQPRLARAEARDEVLAYASAPHQIAHRAKSRGLGLDAQAQGQAPERLLDGAGLRRARQRQPCDPVVDGLGRPRGRRGTAAVPADRCHAELRRAARAERRLAVGG